MKSDSEHDAMYEKSNKIQQYSINTDPAEKDENCSNAAQRRSRKCVKTFFMFCCFLALFIAVLLLSQELHSTEQEHSQRELLSNRTIDDLQHQNIKLNASLQTLQSMYDETQLQLQTAHENITALQAVITELEDKLNLTVSQYEDEKLLTAKLHSDIKDMELQLFDTQMKLNQTLDKIQAQEDDLITLTIQLNQTKTELNNKTNTNDKLTRVINDLQSGITAKKLEISNLSHDINEAKTKITAKEMIISHYKDQLDIRTAAYNGAFKPAESYYCLLIVFFVTGCLY